MEALTMFGPIDTYLAPYIEIVLLLLVLVNLVARHRAHSVHVRQSEDGVEAISRNPLHVASNVLLVLASFYYMTVNHHGGAVLSVLVLSMFIADLFEFEARKVEARRDIPLEKPKGSIGASLFVFLYTAYISLFFLVEPLWDAIV